MESKQDRMLDMMTGYVATQAAHKVRLDSVEKETDQQNARLIAQDKRIRKTETSLGRIWGGVALLTAGGVGSIGAFFAWIRDTIGGTSG